MRTNRLGLVLCGAGLSLVLACGGGDDGTAGGDGGDVLAPAEVAAEVAGDVLPEAGPPDLAPGDEASAADGEGTLDASAGDVAPEQVAPEAYDGPWRKSLKACWTDATCDRVLLVSHGGDWDETLPYDSQAAFHRAYDKGADAIKTDFLVTKDNVGVVAHSSPILFYESPECAGRKIEEMTVAEVTACHVGTSTTETTQRVDEVMEWARGKVLLMLTVKSEADFARAISTTLEHDAADYVFIEAYPGAFQNTILALPDHEKLLYNIDLGGMDEAEALFAQKNPLVFLYEMDATYADTPAAQMNAFITAKLHPAGLKSFVQGDKSLSYDQQRALLDEGFDVLMTYALDAAIQARIDVNTQRGLTPP